MLHLQVNLFLIVFIFKFFFLFYQKNLEKHLRIETLKAHTFVDEDYRSISEAIQKEPLRDHLRIFLFCSFFINKCLCKSKFRNCSCLGRFNKIKRFNFCFIKIRKSSNLS